MVRLNKDFTGLIPFEDGMIYKEVTPKDYVEGPFMFKKNGKYYFMWSEGGDPLRWRYRNFAARPPRYD